METLKSSLLDNVKEFTAFARKRLGDPELAADAVQESLLKAVKAANQIRDEENTKAWFYRILRRTIIDLYRRRDARDRALADFEREVNSPPDVEEERVVCACMERLLPEMTPQYSDLIRQVDLHGAKSDAVAASLGITCASIERGSSSGSVSKRLPGLRAARLFGLPLRKKPNQSP